MEVNNFDAIRISLASPEKILEWSHGEVLKPETINYRTLRPERDGLFCERIFGPTKDWECYCGKYKRVRHKGIVCDKCGVEVAPARVRRERMGHIQLATPVSHIWYVKGVPSRLGLLLDISPRNLERVLYFAQYIITKVDEDQRSRTLQRLEREMQARFARIESEASGQIEAIESARDAAIEAVDAEEAAAIEAAEKRLEELTAETTTKVGRELQAYIEENMGKKLTKPVLLPWSEEPLIEAGVVIERKHQEVLNEALQNRLSDLEYERNQAVEEARALAAAKRDTHRREAEELLQRIYETIDGQKDVARAQIEAMMAEVKSLREGELLMESEYRELEDRWGNIFRAGMGAEAIYELVKKLDLDKMAEELRQSIRTTRSKQRRRKDAKRLRVVESFRKSGNRPEWMILTVLPVIPPDLRPMVQLDGGRFATSDLNDLYRRVINRNNRLRRLLELGAPDVIVRNEKRMLQEAVDSLIDNGRRGRAVSRSGKRKLKSLSDLLKGKQGRFRRNLLGKRVDYSGRSVIVVGPTLKLHQCGLPKKMALELFKPFVMRKLVEHNFAHNIKSAKRLVDRMDPAVWDVLEEIIKTRPVLLNRAPTLHRLGIQAFEVILIEGSAIQLHPLACAAFNADFDGDQMAIHVPLSDAAVAEAREYMLSTKNLLKPASGEPIVGPSKDMVLGCYYLTVADPDAKGAGKVFGDYDEVLLAYELGHIGLRAPIKFYYESWLNDIRLGDLNLPERVEEALAEAGVESAGGIVAILQKEGRKGLIDLPGIGPAAYRDIITALQARSIVPDEETPSGFIDTTVGRVIFNYYMPPQLRFINKELAKGPLNDVVASCYKRLGPEKTAEVVDIIKDIGFYYATRSGTTIAVSDIHVPEAKSRIIEATTAQVEEAERQYRRGLITEEEKYNKVVELWTHATDELTAEVQKLLDPREGLGAMSHSGATKGGVQPIRQLAGMRGLMADPSGRIIALPIRSNFREGLTALEYFLSTHGARKGLADTALRTADAGYLTRRLVDVAQDVIITEEDCGTSAGIWLYKADADEVGMPFKDRIIGRILLQDVIDPETGAVLVPKGTLISEDDTHEIVDAGIEKVFVRSPLTCESRFGICRQCYGRDLGRGGLVELGEAVGIIAAQSIGEPGTQLTLRTFHTGGVAAGEDITQGLPRVEELFEARTPKGEAVISEIDGVFNVYWEGEARMISVTDTRLVRREIEIPEGYTLIVDNEDRVQADTVIARNEEGEELFAGMEGEVYVEDGVVYIRREEEEQWTEQISPTARLRVEKGARVKAGEQLTEGSKNPKEVLRIQGREACQLYLLNEVQKVYRSQGVGIHDKHIEIILRQMLRRVTVTEPGDTEYLPGELVDYFELRDTNDKIVAEGGQPATYEYTLLGVTKASLNTESFLAAASFQETTRVLTDAAVRGATDHLRGLKENVILGKLIPVGTGFRARMEEAARRAAIEAAAAREASEKIESLDAVLDASFTSDTVAELGMPLGMEPTESDLDALLGEAGMSTDGGDGAGEDSGE
ncbi:MAG: DNA-directed RNA polymerase subunit beta' [Caldilineae bacterium]|nr:MAG: DNA-directed RNA polymerase subunit beta' [Caldilineae bacterium]